MMASIRPWLRAAGVAVAVGSGAVAPAAAQDVGRERAVLLPVQDRVGDAEIAEWARVSLAEELARLFELKEKDSLRDALRRLRLRDAADSDPVELRSLSEELDTQWFFSVTLHRARRSPEPQVTVSGWAQRADDTRLTWAGFRSASGRDGQRVLLRGRIFDLETLVDKTVRALVEDFVRSRLGGRDRIRVKPERGGFLLEPLSVEELGTVAVVPFEAVSDGQTTVIAEAVTALARATLHERGVAVTPPGRVNVLLRARGAYLQGLLDPTTRGALRIGGDARHILTGTVEIYDFVRSGENPDPHVSMSARLVSVDTGQIVWIAGRERTGWDRQKLYGVGRVYDPGSLAGEIMRSLVAGFLEDGKG